MSRTTNASIDHANMMDDLAALEGFNEYQDERAARRWFAKHSIEGLKLVLEAAQQANNIPTVN
jgi:hypothetical protein